MNEQQARQAVALRRAIASCAKCSLRAEASAPVPWHGALNPEVAVLGEAPGATEDKEGRPFVGPAGRLLRGIFTKLKYDADSITYLNAANCFPRTSRTPNKEQLSACNVHLVGQIKLVQPAYLLIVGKTALSAVFADRYDLKQIRGRPLWLERLGPWSPFSKPVIGWATYHPAAALRTASYHWKIEEDVQKLLSFLPGDVAFPGDCVKCHKDVDAWDEFGLPWCGDHAGRQLTLI